MVYDMNAAIRPTNYLAAMQDGLSYGIQLRDKRKADADQNMLRGLAPAIISGDPEAYAQAAAVDPDAANAYRGAEVDNLRRMQGFVRFVDEARASGNPERVNAALRAGAPYLRQFLGGREPPTQWTPDMDAGWEQLKARISMVPGESGVQSARAAGLEQLIAGLPPEEQEKARRIELGLDPRAVAPGYSVQEVRNADGSTSFLQVPTRGVAPGTAVPVGLGGPAQVPAGAPPARPATPTPQMDAIIARANQMVAAGLPPEQIDAWVQQQAQAASGVQVGAPAPQAQGIGQTDAQRAQAEAQKAAAVEAARIGAQQAAAPAQAALDAQREAAVVMAREGAENTALKAAQAEQAITKADQTISLIDQALAHPGRATATGASGTYDPRNYLPGTAARDFQVLLNQLKGQTFLEAFQSLKGGGAITQVEGTKAEQAIARLETAQSDEAFVQALRDLRGVADAARQRAQRNQGGESAPPPAPGARQAPDGNWYVLVDGQYYRVEQ